VLRHLPHNVALLGLFASAENEIKAVAFAVTITFKTIQP